MDNYSISNNYELYIWDDFCCDYTCGLAVAVASSLEEAKDIVAKECGDCVSQIDWGSYYKMPLNAPFAISITGGS